MLLNPYRFGAANVVSFVQTSGAAYATATSIANGNPNTAVVGDLYVAAVMHRSALTTPAGWTVIDTISFTDGGTTQDLTVLRKTVTAPDIGSVINWVQASAVRIGVNVVAFRGTVSTPTVVTTAKTSTVVSANVQPMAIVSGSASGQIGFAAQSRTTANTGANSISVSSPFTLTTPSGITDNRLFGAYRALTASDSTNGSFTADPIVVGGAESISIVLG